MALTQIIDLEAHRRARSATSLAPHTGLPQPVWCYMWTPVYLWYVA